MRRNHVKVIDQLKLNPGSDEIVSMRLARFFGMHGNQYPIDRVGPIEGSFILGIREDGSYNRLVRLCGCTNVWYVERNYGAGVLPALFF
jgi:hypothetical protein